MKSANVLFIHAKLMNDTIFASDIKNVPLDAELVACKRGVASCFCANLWKHNQNIVPPTD